jgi:hypothetical protein
MDLTFCPDEGPGPFHCSAGGPVGFGSTQPLQLVADLSQQLFPPRNVGVGFDTQR